MDPGFPTDIAELAAVVLAGRVYPPGSGRVGVIDLTSCRLSAFAADEASRA